MRNSSSEVPVVPASNGDIFEAMDESIRFKPRCVKRQQKLTNHHTIQAFSDSFTGPDQELPELRSQKWSCYAYAVVSVVLHARASSAEAGVQAVRRPLA